MTIISKLFGENGGKVNYLLKSTFNCIRSFFRPCLHFFSLFLSFFLEVSRETLPTSPNLLSHSLKNSISLFLPSSLEPTFTWPAKSVKKIKKSCENWYESGRENIYTKPEKERGKEKERKRRGHWSNYSDQRTKNWWSPPFRDSAIFSTEKTGREREDERRIKE